MTPDKDLVDKAIEAVFASELLPCERGDWLTLNAWTRVNVNNDIAVIPCGNSAIDVRKLVTLVIRVIADGGRFVWRPD